MASEVTDFAALGRVAVRHPRRVLAAWAILLAASVPFAPRVGGALQAGGFILPDLESARAHDVLERELGLAPSALVLVFRSETLRAGTPGFESAVADATADVASAPHVKGVLSHLIAPRQVSADGRTAYDVVLLDLPPDRSPDALPIIKERLRPTAGLDVLLGGGPAFYGDVQAVSEADLRRSELISLPLATLALLLVFGSVMAAGVPLVVGGGAVVVALAAIFLVASLTPMSIFVLNLATLLGLGLGVDYSLLMTNRFREELAARGGGADAVGDAVVATVESAGRAVFFSGLTVLLGLAGLVLFEFMVLRSVGIAGAIVVGLAVLAALTLLPAVLTIVGTRIDALSLGRRRSNPEGDGYWARLAGWVMERPIAVLVPTLGLLVLLGGPFLHVRFNAPDASILPPSVPSREAYEVLAREFGEGEFAPIVLAVRTDGPATDRDNVAALDDYSRRLGSDPRIARIRSLVDVDPRLGLEQYQLLYADPSGPRDLFFQETLRATTRGDLTAFTLITPYGPNREEGRALVRDLRDPDGPLAPPEGATVLVGGGAADVSDVVDRIGADFPRTAALILVSTWVVLFLLLRSVVLPIKALAMNTLSIVASFGALVWIFQDGNLSAPLGFAPLGYVETTQPVILFCVLFGLSMDYEVFLLSRMKEAWDQTGDNREAVTTGLERSGRIVTSAALIVVVVAGSFAFADIVLVKAIGLGVAIAVALDATVVRALLVPATMRLLGRWNWWAPRRLGRAGVAIAALVTAGVVLAGCGAPILANPVAERRPPLAPSERPSPAPDPRPVAFPADDGPHDRLTEWWYYTGHLQAVDGRRFGFEYVIFRVERGDFPVSWASHVALTDETAGRFLYAQRLEVGPQVAAASGEGFDLAIRDAGRALPWAMRGAGGHDALSALATQAESGWTAFGLDLRLATDRAPALHDRDGWIDFGPGGSSYYYSRTRMEATGSVRLGDVDLPVSGTGWFDHQWGDFISVGGAGWDWFAINLDDGTDLSISVVRDPDGGHPLVYGTIVGPEGSARHLERDAFSIEETGRWTSPRTGADYPAGWRIDVPGESLTIELEPTLADQELDTRPTTGVVYWEGSQVVTAERAGRRLGGEAYVELTGYPPAR
jgi:RND superfamily putative drug exporter